MAKASRYGSTYTLAFEQPVIELDKQIQVLKDRDKDRKSVV